MCESNGIALMPRKSEALPGLLEKMSSKKQRNPVFFEGAYADVSFFAMVREPYRRVPHHPTETETQ